MLTHHHSQQAGYLTCKRAKAKGLLTTLHLCWLKYAVMRMIAFRLWWLLLLRIFGEGDVRIFNFMKGPLDMGLEYKIFCLLSLVVLFPRLCSSQDPFICSRATYYGSPDCLGTPRGACGYSEFGKTINRGDVGAVSRLYRNGTGCGACYQVRCTHVQLCTDNGVTIVATDYGEGDHTDFILSPSAFVKLARPNMASELVAYGVVDIEYRRVPCQYPGNNFMFKIHEHSRFPNYLALIILYQSGQRDVVAVELWQEDCQEWRGMRRAFGAVWDMPDPPKGLINIRFQVSGVDGETWILLSNIIPGDWKTGAAYDSAIQLS
ncbi:Expansin/pollen allergen [Cinnamomum micranthum f. kanehirae]|uniref:Expansin/pollen allergen n=1 Tax=Cinnamomum micranthum f. kanehirae TaxID=337451 RepID=A0A443NR57_9MAGN|nr:Expansin/pollen allergen [Cinnamomum micranthum f. kanehirae]